ncbi:hypothetical protein [Pseudodesulfovibrio methanolicus]|uniref:Uncharacterized protein n=1 Tax=Pseudodesulfovibrio methanolicus TaxID=3126690 RepID=A0ABZ2IUD3_9BACT
MLVTANQDEIQMMSGKWEPIYEPALKNSIKMGTPFEIEFREIAGTRDFKYKDREPPRFFFAVITTRQQHSFFLLTQKNKIRYFSEKAAYKWLKDINYFGPCILRSDIEPRSPKDHVGEPTLAQLHGNQLDVEKKKLDDVKMDSTVQKTNSKGN